VQASVEPAGSLRVATYNIHRGIGTDGRRNTERVASVIRELQADVIGLQEVDWHQESGETVVQSEYLAHMPGYQAIRGANLRDHRGHFGNLLLTRFGARRVDRINLSQAGREPRGAIDAELALSGGCFRVIVTHFGLGGRERLRQATRLQEALAAWTVRPTLILGDFNEWRPFSPSLRPLLRFCKAWRSPASFPSRCPVLALDRIMTCIGPWRLAVWRHNSPLSRNASDHLPIVGEMDTAVICRQQDPSGHRVERDTIAGHSD
jgi:endonuclease/exonuclease/phosphatase family metal-dependent hydrolase